MSEPITRPDCLYLPIGERFYLTLSAIEMVEEGLSAIYDEAIEDGVEPDDMELHESLADLRTSSYASLLQTMTNSNSERSDLVKLMKLNEQEARGQAEG